MSLLTLGLLSNALAETHLVSWNVATCTDAQGQDLDVSDKVTVVAGITKRCELQVNSVPYNSEIVRADFQYELIYEDNFFGFSLENKLLLPGTDTVMYDGRSAQGVVLRQDWNSSTAVHIAEFSLPLSINVRSRVQYTYVGMKGVLIFSGGTRKQVYERIPVFYL